MIEYDGEEWKRFRASKGYTRSLHIVNDSIIFTGSDMDFGIWKKNKLKKFQYRSLYPFTTKIGGVNEEFWGTYEHRGKMIFVSHQNLYAYNYKILKKISAPYSFSESFQVNGRIFLADERKGFFEYKNNQLQLVFDYPSKLPLEISGVYFHQNQLRIVTKDQGIFAVDNGSLKPFNTEISELLIKNKVFSFDHLENRYLVFGTILDGLYLTDLNGKIKKRINKSTGLPNNTILSLHYQKNGRLWMGLDFGISFFNLKSNIQYFNSSSNDFGTGYTAAVNEQQFYLGTNQGLYTADWNKVKNASEDCSFQILKGSEGQVWTIENIDGKIYCGHHNGLFEIDSGKLIKIYDQHGILCLKKISEKYLLAGNYNGIAIFRKEGDSWRFLKKMPLILGAVSQILVNRDKTIWIHIPNYGVVKFILDESLQPKNRQFISLNDLEGNFPSLFQDSKGMHVVTSTSQYDYISSKRKFLENNQASQNVKVKNLFTGFYKPILLDKDYGFYSINNGFALEDFKKNKKQDNFSSHLLFRKASAFGNDSNVDLVDGGHIAYQYNNLKFSFLVPNEDGVEYQFFLKNFSKNWSGWSRKNTAEFLGLKEGIYIFQIRAKSDNKISEVHEFVVHINAPWYRSFASYLGYFLLFLATIYFIRKYNKAKLNKQENLLLKKQKESLEVQAEKHKSDMVLQRQQQLELEQNKLREEIKNKTIELATKAKDDEDKNRLLCTLSEKIAELEHNPNILQIRLGEMRRLLKTYLESEDNTFEIQMDELHQEFFKMMKKKFPNLSIYDLRLCAYLRIGLTSKEMADILHVLPSSINVSRSRLRKKLSLQPEDDLYEFLINLEK